MRRRRLVAVTQRVAEVPSYGELRDCLDQEWTSWLSTHGFTPIPVPNRIQNVSQFLEDVGVEGAILTGGNSLALDIYEGDRPLEDVSEIRDRTEMAVIEHCAEAGLPVVGFCRGMQTLHAFSGGRLVGLGDGPTQHVASFHEVSLVSEEWREMAGTSQLEVNSFHDYGFTVDQIAPGWEVSAVSPLDDVVEGFAHRTLPFFGVQWHPERVNRAPRFDSLLLERAFGSVDGVEDRGSSRRR